MTDLQGTVLRGLPGDNPLGFLAALGAQVALEHQGLDYRLHWTDSPIPHPVVSPSLDLDAIAMATLAVAREWLAGPALSREIDQTLKVGECDVREYLKQNRGVGRCGKLAFSLLAEGSHYHSGNAIGKSKPTDFYFTAARQQFLAMARSRLESTNAEDVVADIGNPWRYSCDDNYSLMWDLLADRHHAYSAADPNDHRMNPKRTNAGAELLAILGISLFSCFGHRGALMTQSFHGSGPNRRLVWPLWCCPASLHGIKALLGHVTSPVDDVETRSMFYPAWGISRVMESHIRSRGQGFRTFAPPLVVWQRE